MPAIESTLRPKLKAPAGTCDTHMHVYDGRNIRRRRPPRSRRRSAGDGLIGRVRARLGVTHTVVVQPSTYGKDNSCTLAAIAALGESARCIAVVDESVTDVELDRLTRLGIRGIRFFMLVGGTAALGHPGNHVGAGRPLRLARAAAARRAQLPDRVALSKKLPGTLVVDHVGKFLEPVPLDHPGFRTLRGLVDGGRTWVKLSAPYEVFEGGAAELRPMSVNSPRRLQKPRPNGCYGPPIGRIRHQACQVPDDALMLDMLLDWVPDESARKEQSWWTIPPGFRILTDHG